MTNPIVDAIPATGNKAYDQLRQSLALSTALPLEDSTAVAAFHSLDLAADFTPYPAVIYAGTVYEYDKDDALTAHDPDGGCITDASGRRYIRTIALKPDHTIEDKDLTEPPASPVEGRAWFVATAATGAWAGHDGEVAIYGARGWHWRTPKEGDLLYVSDEKAYYHIDENGDPVKGVGDLGLGDGSITIDKLANRFGYSVADELTAPPPSVPAAGTAYLVGIGATGDWTGEDINIAVSTGSAWNFLTAAEGDFLFDRGAGLFRKLNGGEWQAAAGNVVQAIPVNIDATYALTIPQGTVCNLKTIPIKARAGDAVCFHFLDFNLEIAKSGASSTKTYTSGTGHLKRDTLTANIVDLVPQGSLVNEDFVKLGTETILAAVDVVTDDASHDYHLGFQVYFQSAPNITAQKLKAIGTIFVIRQTVEGA